MEREIFADGRAAGTLRTEPDGADTCFSLSCRLGPGLWRLWVEGTSGRLLLGTLEGGGPVTLRRRFSDRLVRPVGTVVRGLAEEVGAARADAWYPAREIPSFPAAAALPEGALVRRAGSVWLAAVPCAEDAPFPLTELFCLARIEAVAGRRCAVFAFDASGWPILRGDSAKQ